MSDPQSSLTPRAPFAGLFFKSTAGGGVVVCDRDGLGLATVLVRKARHEALAERLREQVQIDLPQGPLRTSAGGFALMGTGPGAWLATKEQGGNAFAASIAEMLGDLASISDQSDGYAVLRLSGPKVRDTLSKLVPVDVHPLAFRIGAVATTVAAHIDATLWRLDDRSDGSPIFEIAVFRSLVASFGRALSESAAQFGIEIA
jgi:methylglutamate dehydrogenase subunit D